MYFVSFQTDFYNFATAAAIAVDTRLEWELLLYLPLAFGSVVILFSGISITASLLSVGQAERLDELLLRAMGKRLNIEEKYGDCDKCLAVLSRILVFTFLVLQLIAAVALFAFLLYVEDSIGEIGTDDIGNQTLTARVFDFQYALFNECCFAQGFSRQGEILSCPDVACTLPVEFAIFAEDTLCGRCFRGPTATYARYQQAIATNNMCGVLAKQQVSLEGQQTLPGTQVSVDFVFTKSTVPLVGRFEDDGCGVGLAAGFQWIHVLFILSYIRNFVYVFVSVSALQMALIAFIFYRNYTGYAEAKTNEQIARLQDPERNLSRISQLFNTLSSTLFGSTTASSKNDERKLSL